MWTAVLTLLALLCSGVESYSTGAPFATCLTMFPKHGTAERQSGPTPFRIELRPSSYRPGQIITVVVMSDDHRPFKGIQIKAVRSQGDTESVLGTFVQIPANITKVFSCEGSYKNMVTHTSAMTEADTTEIRLTWKAPRTNEGNIVFVASIVEKFDTFWTGVTAPLMSEHPEKAKSTVNSFPDVNTSMDRIRLDLCGQDRGCFLYPRYCSGPNDCKAAATYRRVGSSNSGSSSGSADDVDDDTVGDDIFQFEMMARDAAYVSLGFSRDILMGEDETVTCTADDQILNVQHGFNPKYYNHRIVRHQLSDLQVNHTNGHIICSFRRPRVTVTRFVNQSAPELQYISTTYDLTNDYYLMLAWGTVKKGSDVINMHKEMPPVTDTKVNFQSYTIHRGSALSVEVKVHGSLMAVAWVFVAGLTTTISRYYKHWLSNRVFCGSSIWFQVHRAAAITVGVLTGTAATLITIKIGGFSQEYRHAIMGLVVVCLVGIQILSGLLRPERGSRYRTLFKWSHMVLGLSAHILSAVTMYLALDIRYVPAVMREFGVTVLTGWVPLQIGWTIVLELRRCCTVQQGVKKEKEPWWEVLKSPDTLLLFFYCLTLLLLMSATLSAILVF